MGRYRKHSLLPVSVEVARADEKFVLIKSGLEPGQLISLTVPENPLPGTAVRYQETVDGTGGLSVGSN